MSTSIHMKLSTDDIAKAIREIKAYKSNLQKKCHEFVDKLADEGIDIAVQNKGKYGDYITFGKEIVDGNKGVYGVMYGTSRTVFEYWLTSDGKVQGAEITPILMAEFGSGKKASDASGLANADIAKELGMGRGTFFKSGNYLIPPERNHAFQESWAWKDVMGVWHESSGEQPTMPMFKASIIMKLQVRKIAKEVFGS